MSDRQLWGISIYSGSFEEACKQIVSQANKLESKLVVTAYSEFFVRAFRYQEFGTLMERAWMVVPDGVSVLAALDYVNAIDGKSTVARLFEGLKVGSRVLAGKFAPITGVSLFGALTKEAGKQKQRVFLLGAAEGVASEVAKKLVSVYPQLVVEFDSGEKRLGAVKEEAKRIKEKINKFKPHYLFVAYGPGKQEQWLDEVKSEIKFGVGMGVGGTFDEYLGRFPVAPAWMEKMGLKWLWRVLVNPARFLRIVDAVIVFPWLVYRRGNKKPF